ncbi:MAG: beta-ketoacyl-ACP synthase III [Gammaproteobacteria bacterium]
MKYSRIAGTGRCLPKRVVTNAELAKTVETSDEWIRERTGIAQRYVAGDDESTLTLCEGAARQAMDAAGVGPEDIDLILVGTTTPDQIFPNMGVLLQARLGIRTQCPSFGLEAACTGFIYALSLADKFIKLGEAKRALVVGAETLSRMIDWTDRTTCVLFGDGAGAVVLEAADEAGIVSTHLHADGQYKDLLYHPWGVSQGADKLVPGHDAVRMTGNEVFKVAVKTLGSIVDETLAANKLQKTDIDWLIPHQANIRIIEATAKKLGMPMDRVVVTVAEHGNTSAASVPMALDVAVRDGRVKRGDLLLLEAFGGGFTWGSALIRY